MTVMHGRVVTMRRKRAFFGNRITFRAWWRPEETARRPDAGEPGRLASRSAGCAACGPNAVRCATRIRAPARATPPARRRDVSVVSGKRDARPGVIVLASFRPIAP